MHPSDHAGKSLSGANSLTGQYHFAIIDDDDDLLFVFEHLLSNGFPQCRVSQFRKPQDLLDALATETFDLLVVDHGLRGCTGIELLPLLRSRGFNGPVIGVSGNSTLEHEFEAAGAAAFLEKVDTISKLCPVARELLKC
jgi:DNA-binding NtrC family response regulator